MSHLPYSQLLKEHTRNIHDDESVRKKRRTRQSLSPEVIEIESTSNHSESDVDSDEFEDIEFQDVAQQQSFTGEESEDEPDYTFLNQPINQPESENITISIPKPVPEKSKRKVAYISKEERDFRVMYHQMYLAAMICHGAVRNRWCSDYDFLVKMKKSVSADVIDELSRIRRNNRISTVNAVRFTDVVRTLMLGYNSKFRVSKEGLVRKNWNELSIRQTNTIRDMTFTKFKNCIYGFQGSRDVGAQGFLAICRSLGMRARLVFSIQPPDYTMVSELPKIDLKQDLQQSKGNLKNSKQNFLNKTRPKTEEISYKFPSSSYPIFWVEVWNKYNKRWLCVDPIVLKLVEHPPKRRKSSFEPPMADPTNNLLYAIAFAADGGIKDVTRRYAQQYNSRVVKKRITSKSDTHADWYQRMINSASASTKLSKIDILELKEFRDRDLAEGMPNNAAGFKDHPIYAIESQLRQNEIIYPKDSTTKCGTFRFKTAKGKDKDLVEVYKRTAVRYLRSPKAWHLRGRVLKIGERPLKTKVARKFGKKSNTPDFSDDEDQEETRLYADFQTKLYIPPPVENGKIPKNAYGNIDVYVPTMLPDGAYLYKVDDNVTIKLLEQAARLLEIDFARAIVAFEFGKNGKRSTRIPTAKEGGVVIALEYKEAMELAVAAFIEDSYKQKMQQIEMNALKNWKYILTKLRVTKRLERSHGKIEEDTKEVDDESSDFSVYSEDEGSDFQEGGFVAAEMVADDEDSNTLESGQVPQEAQVTQAQNWNDDSDFEEGGFVAEETNPEAVIFDNFSVEEAYQEPQPEAKSWNEDSDFEGGGFLAEEAQPEAMGMHPNPRNTIELDSDQHQEPENNTRKGSNQVETHSDAGGFIPETPQPDQSNESHSNSPDGSHTQPLTHAPHDPHDIHTPHAPSEKNPTATHKYQNHPNSQSEINPTHAPHLLIIVPTEQPDTNAVSAAQNDTRNYPNQVIVSEELESQQQANSEVDVLLAADHLFSQKNGRLEFGTYYEERNQDANSFSDKDASDRDMPMNYTSDGGIEDAEDEEGYEFEYSDEE